MKFDENQVHIYSVVFACLLNCMKSQESATCTVDGLKITIEKMEDQIQ